MKNRNISLISAVACDGAIGEDNKLLIYVPGDLPRLKKLTLNHTVIVGRKTLESFPGGKTLPNRNFIVITRNKNFSRKGVVVAHSVEEALELCKDEKEVFCMGGGEIYKLLLPYANKMYLTIIQKLFSTADTFFPKINKKYWKKTNEEINNSKEKCNFNFAFIDYERIK